MRKVKFIADFANKRVGDVCEYNSQLASSLVNDDNVAEYSTDDLKVSNPDAEHIEVESTDENAETEVVEVKKLKKTKKA